MKYLLSAFSISAAITISAAQKVVLSYPFQYQTAIISKESNADYFLEGGSDSGFAFILKDSKNAAYIQVNKSVKVVSNFQLPAEQTVLNSNEEYLGGTANNGIYHFVYKIDDKKPFLGGNVFYQEETVNFNTKTISNKALYEIPETERRMASFCDNNRYFTVTVDVNTNAIKLYFMNENGETTIKSFAFSSQANSDKEKKELVSLLRSIAVIKQNEEPELSYAIQPVKLFSYNDKLVFVVNQHDKPTHILKINLDNFSSSETFIDHTPLENTKAKDKSDISSFYYNNTLFSIILNSDNIKIGVYNPESGSLLQQYEINYNTNFSMFAQPPVYEERKGKKSTEKDIEDVSKLIKAFNSGTEGITIYKNKTGQCILTIGTYDLIDMQGGGSMPSGQWVRLNANQSSQAPGYVYSMIGPGKPSYTVSNTLFYRTTYFKIILDSSTYKIAKGKLSLSVNEQIKDYMGDAEGKSQYTNQFLIDDKQYYSYYDKDSKQYIVEQIVIRK